MIYYYGQALDQPGAIDQPARPEWEFFDLEADPFELNNRYKDPAYADQAAALKAELDRLQAGLGDTSIH